ncbi:methyl coenzyme M reductase system, component A2 [Methanosarcinales archaeon]|nr:MAG: methyl coenzyme M reductase system, component A2 [Methanosarcinales archaeon]
MTALIDIKNLSMEFKGKKVLKDINLTIEEGECIGILGRSGAGKTVLMHLLRGIKEHETSSGEVIYHIAYCENCAHAEPPSKVGTPCPKCGTELTPMDADFVSLDKYSPLRRSIATRIAIMLQRTFALYGDERVITNVINALIEINYPATEAVDRAADLIDQVNLSHRMMHVARELSGGEKQRVVLARQLAKEPMVLLADEPTGTLDRRTAEAVHESIIAAKEDYGMTLAITSHWSGVIEELADRAILLEDGEIVEQGDPKKVVERFMSTVGTVGSYTAEIGEPIIKVHDLKKTYISVDRGVVRAVDNISFEVSEGEIFGLVGVSGAGKTTASKILNGSVNATAGDVEVRIGDDWIDLTDRGAERAGRAVKHIGLLHQEYSLYPHRNVLDNLTESIGLELPGELGERKSILVLKTAGFTEDRAREVLEKMPDELSVGEAHRVAMAQVLIKEPRIIILDEPTGTMDPVTRVDVTKSILEAREELGETFIIVSHDMDFVVDVCDRAALMRDGKVIEIGDVDTVIAKLDEGEREEMYKS